MASTTTSYYQNPSFSCPTSPPTLRYRFLSFSLSDPGKETRYNHPQKIKKDTSYNQTPSSSTPTSPPTQWDVFLSFRGKDTRFTFSDHLYNALHRTNIRTFKDDPDLRSGEVISDSLIQAIQDSKTYIVVLSENYASSPWCLDELVEILDCYKRMKRLVIPVFYNIDPSVVRHQLESFKEAFEKHRTRFDMKKLNKWGLTLNEVADFSGYHVSENRSQADIVDEVVDRVLLEINPVILDVAKYPVGLDSRVKDVTALSNSDTGVIRIGIHGMGGVGKTTLAKAVYNQNYQRFQGSCFLANVREASRTEKGLVCLQQQLINDVLKRNTIIIGNVDQGIEIIRARICSTKVLIVIDDLDDPKPLEYLEVSFALGSVILVTTRNEDLLDSIKVQAKYKVNELDDDQSRQLFARHAFGDDEISDTFTELSKDILKRAGGLPLALKVFGSNLKNQPEEEWRWFINKLNRVPIDDIERKLLISFDALSTDPMLQNIFLDIACFFIGQPKETVVGRMKTCYKFVNRNIDILKKRCLLTINDRDELGMHDLLRDMGREIARNNSPDEPGKHSRLWNLNDVYNILKNDKGTEAIQGIITAKIGKPYAIFDREQVGVSFGAHTFKRMSNLRLLYLNNVNLTGSFEHTFEDLRWLYWAHCPLWCLPYEFYPKKLVALELPFSKMKTMWALNMVPQVFEKLKTLDISASPNITTTPDFNNMPCLETLSFRGCTSLEEVHISIGSLTRLVSLDLGYCWNLRSLPDSICNLRALEVLDINTCEKLEKLPDQLGKITSLGKLDIRGAIMLKMLPDISQLSNIRHLDIGLCKCMLSIAGLPPNLKSINAEYCRSLERLPNLSNLKQLRNLNLTDCSALTEIQGLDGLISLRELDLSGCNSSLLAYTLTKRLFQIFCGFEHTMIVYLKPTDIPYWDCKSREATKFLDWTTRQTSQSTMSLDLSPNASHNFLAMILYFERTRSSHDYFVKNISSGFIWSDRVKGCDSCMVIVPRSIISIRDGHNNIEVTINIERLIINEGPFTNKGLITKIHPVYKTEITDYNDWLV